MSDDEANLDDPRPLIDLPADVLIPAKLVLTEESARQVLAQLDERPEPTPAMVARLGARHGLGIRCQASTVDTPAGFISLVSVNSP